MINRRRRVSKPPGLALDQIGAHGVLLLMVLLSLAPFVWMIFASFKSFKELVTSHDILPHIRTLNNYREIINRVNSPTAFANSFVVAVVVTVTTLFTSATLGYIFAKYRFGAKRSSFCFCWRP